MSTIHYTTNGRITNCNKDVLKSPKGQKMCLTTTMDKTTCYACLKTLRISLLTCDFCGGERGRNELIIRDDQIAKKDKADLMVCAVCFNYWCNQDWDELTKRLKA